MVYTLYESLTLHVQPKGGPAMTAVIYARYSSDRSTGLTLPRPMTVLSSSG